MPRENRQERMVLDWLADGQPHCVIEAWDRLSMRVPTWRLYGLRKKGFLIEKAAGRGNEGREKKRALGLPDDGHDWWWWDLSDPKRRGADLDSPGLLPASAATGQDRPTSPPRIPVPPRRPVKQRVCSSGSARTERDLTLRF
jgi:hypothetical protein